MFISLSEKLKKMREAKGTAEAAEPVFKEYDEVDPISVNEIKETSTMSRPIAPMIANTGDSNSNIELKVVRPKSFEEVSTVADYLLDGCTVFLNMELLDGAAIVRMLDFLNGVTYCTDGDIKNVSRSTYIITPHNVDVSDED